MRTEITVGSCGCAAVAVRCHATPVKSGLAARTESARLGVSDVASLEEPVDVQLVVTDLDGTLWHNATDVHPRTRDALARLEGAGIPLVVATGRRVASTRGPLQAIGIAPAAVVLNGALGLDLSTGARFHRGGFTAEDAVVVLDVFRAHGMDPCVYVDHDDYAVWVSTEPATHPDHLAGFGADARTGDLARAVVTDHVLGFSVLGIAKAAAVTLGEALAGLATPHVDRDAYYDNYAITVAPLTQSKWDGVAAYCKEHDLDPGAVLALGDGPNDVEMLDKAAVAVAPHDAHPDALARADHVIASARDGGWADVLDLIGLD
jgi:HAD superfamily hydrolase (TIGR01484 family)